MRLSFDNGPKLTLGQSNDSKKKNQLANDGKQHYPFYVVPFYWLKVKDQYVHHFLQHDI